MDNEERVVASSSLSVNFRFSMYCGRTFFKVLPFLFGLLCSPVGALLGKLCQESFVLGRGVYASSFVVVFFVGVF